MRRRCINFLLTYFHNSSKKAYVTKYSIKSTINSTEAKIKLSFQGRIVRSRDVQRGYYRGKSAVIRGKTAVTGTIFVKLPR